MGAVSDADSGAAATCRTTTSAIADGDKYRMYYRGLQAGQLIRLRFVLKDADLYSFQFLSEE